MSIRHRVGNSIVLNKPVTMVTTGTASGGVEWEAHKEQSGKYICRHAESYSEIDLVGPKGVVVDHL